MAWKKAQTAIVTGAVVVLAAGTTAITVRTIGRTNPRDTSQTDDNSWLRTDLSWTFVDHSLPPEVRILPTRFHERRLMGNVDGTKWVGHDVPVSEIVRVAYQWSSGRILFDTPEPPGGYDFVSGLPQGSFEALQHELQKQLGLVGHVETTNTDVLVLNVRTPNAPGLRPPVIGAHRDFTAYTDHSRSGGEFVCNNSPLSTGAEPFFGLQRFLENNLNMPVVDETGLTGNFSIDFKWHDSGPNHEGLKQALANQLGMDRVPARRPVEMLVIASQ